MWTNYRFQFLTAILILLLAGAGSSRADGGEAEKLNDANFAILCETNSRYSKAKACEGATRYRELMKKLEERVPRRGKANPGHRFVCAALCGASDAENLLQAQVFITTGDDRDETYARLAEKCDFRWQFLFRDYGVRTLGDRIDVGPMGDLTADTACAGNPSFDAYYKIPGC